MKIACFLRFFFAAAAVLPTGAFQTRQVWHIPRSSTLQFKAFNDPQTFLGILDYDSSLNDATSERTRMLTSLIANKLVVDASSFPVGKPAGTRVSISNPGRLESMMKVAAGTWKVIYAPHMKLGEALFGGGNLDVQYILYPNRAIESHARVFNFPWMLGIRSIYLSVSGTFGSVSDDVCEVIWEEAWVRTVSESDDDDHPYSKMSDAPDSLAKTLITTLGKLLFIRPVSVFPVSFLSENLIVFDFELLGTRICARKVW